MAEGKEKHTHTHTLTPLSRRDGSVSAEAKCNQLTVQDPGPVPASGVRKLVQEPAAIGTGCATTA